MSVFPDPISQGVAWQRIASDQLTAATVSLVISGIAPGFRLLRAQVYVKADATGGTQETLIRVNNDSSAVYVDQRGIGDAGVVSGIRLTGQTQWASNAISILNDGIHATSFMLGRSDSGSDLMGTGLSHDSIAANQAVNLFGWRWNSAGEVDRLDVIVSDGLWQVGSEMVLEGVAA